MLKKLIVYLLLLTTLFVIVLLTCNNVVVNYARHKVFDGIDSIQPVEVGLLLGTTPQTRIDGGKNMFFRYRIDATEELYKAGKIKFILISGDENSLGGINEPECMKDSLLARGIPDNVIFLDGKGFRTLDSVIRMSKVFGAKEFTIISQRFHNERALYLAEHLGLGLDVDKLQAYNAKDPRSSMSMMTYVREYFARIKMFFDIWTDKQPLNLEDGEPLEIDGKIFGILHGGKSGEPI